MDIYICVQLRACRLHIVEWNAEAMHAPTTSITLPTISFRRKRSLYMHYSSRDGWSITLKKVQRCYMQSLSERHQSLLIQSSLSKSGIQPARFYFGKGFVWNTAPSPSMQQCGQYCWSTLVFHVYSHQTSLVDDTSDLSVLNWSLVACQRESPASLKS